MNKRLSIIREATVFMLFLTIIPAYAADWITPAKKAADLVTQKQTGPAAAKVIEALGNLRSASVSDDNQEVQKLFAESYTHTMLQLSNANDYKSADTLGRWATNVSESKFGRTSPLTFVSYSVFGVFVLGSKFNHFTKNRDAEDKSVQLKLKDIVKSQTPIQKAQSQRLMARVQIAANAEILQATAKTVQNAISDRSPPTNAAKSYPSSAYTTRKSPVVYAIVDIPKGSVISSNALEERQVAISEIPSDAYVTSRLVVGRTAKYGISKGQMVSQHDLAPVSH